ncbi:hypothetical protein CEP54_001655 [Fusarium duplospermum]|uniref:Uncharacterized protein n=1 Tax=Fusarium duplospermum TaxID=1325734 RepID=A0A428QZQ5_9HYPO|nr:hypothetical protein CEP54_001655 [Fusarium duplospermum]
MATTLELILTNIGFALQQQQLEQLDSFHPQQNRFPAVSQERREKNTILFNTTKTQKPCAKAYGFVAPCAGVIPLGSSKSVVGLCANPKSKAFQKVWNTSAKHVGIAAAER